MHDTSPSPGSHESAPDDRTPSTDGPGAGDLGHTERLTVPWWWWPPVLAVAVLLAAEVHMGYPGVRAWLPYLVTVPVAVLVLVRLGRVRVAAGRAETARTAEGAASGADGGAELEIRADRAHMPARFVGRVDVVAGEAKQQALGPELDPQAFVLHRPWIGPAVRLEVLDPDDPTPYWVVSTRHPDRLIASLRRG